MQSYIERATKIILDSGLPAMVLLSDDDNALCVFWPIFAGIDTPPPTEFANTRVRSVGTIGVTGNQLAVAFNEDLESSLELAIATSYAAYVNTTNSLEIAELEKMYQLQLADPRLN